MLQQRFHHPFGRPAISIGIRDADHTSLFAGIGQKIRDGTHHGRTVETDSAADSEIHKFGPFRGFAQEDDGFSQCPRSF